jgi:hypothetical protein
MANTEIIDKLVSEKALDDLGKLNVELAKSYDEWERLLPKIQAATTEFDRFDKSANELYKAIGMLNKLEAENAALSKKVSDLHREKGKIEQEVLDTEVRRGKVVQEGIKAEVQKKDAVEASIAAQKEGTRQIEQQEKATQSATDTLKRFISETKALSEIDSSKVVGEYSKGMLSHGNALQALTQQLERATGLQRGLTDEFKNGNVTEQQYNDAMTQLLLKQSEFRQSIESLTVAYDKNREAKSGVYAFSGEAFAGLSDGVKQQAVALADTNIALNDVRAAMKELDKQYKDGEVTVDAYTQKRAQLKNAESELSKAIKTQSRELQLNREIANAAEGSYDSLSAKYSLMKMEINALGEAESKDAERKRELEREAKALYERMNELQTATGKHQLTVGDYEIAARSLKGELGRLSEEMAAMILNGKKGSEAYNQMAKKAADLKKAISEADKEVNKISKSTKENENIFKKFTGVANQYWAAILVGYKAFEKALSGYKDIMMSNIGTGREFQATMDGLSNSLGYLKTAIATMDFSNLIAGLTNAYTVGKEASRELAELFERRNSFSILSKESYAEIEEMKVNMRDANVPLEERIALGYTIEKGIEKIKEMELNIAKQELAANIKLLQSQTNLTEGEMEYYIDKYEHNRDIILQTQKIIDLEKKRDEEIAKVRAEGGGTAGSASEAQKEAEKIRKAYAPKIEAAKSNFEVSEAYNMRKRYESAGTDFITNYVKSQELLSSIRQAESRETKMIIRTRSGYEQQLTREQAQEQKKRADEQMRVQRELLKNAGESKALEYKESADHNEMLYKDTTLSYEKRLEALRAWTDDEIAIIEEKSKREQEQVDLTEKNEILAEDQKRLIRKKAAYEIVKLEAERAEKIRDLNAEEADRAFKDIQENISRESAAMDAAMQDELVKRARQYEEEIKQHANSEQQRKKITEQYAKDRAEIVRKYSMDALNFEIEQLKKALEITNLTEKEKADILKEIEKLRAEAIKRMAEYEVNQTEDKIEKILTLEQKLKKFLEDERTKAVMKTWEVTLDTMNMYYDEQLNRIDELEKREKEYWDEKLKMIDVNVEVGLMSEKTADAKRRIIEEDQAKREKELEQQRKDMQKKQSVWQKSNAMIQAAINTALAVTSAIATPPAPLGIALAAIVGAMGAAQIAMIASQTVPSYARGTKDHAGGPAIVGDGGRSEMVVLPSGGIWKTPATDTFAYLPKGAEVLPDFRTAFADMFSRPYVPCYDDHRVDTGHSPYVQPHDDVLRRNTKEMNVQLNAIDRSIRAIRANSVYNDKRAMLAYRFNKISRHGS